jgi:hypothetical protein
VSAYIRRIVEKIKGYKNYVINKDDFKIYYYFDFYDRWIEVKPSASKGFITTKLYVEFGKLKTFPLHRVIAEQWIPNTNNYKYVKHKDNNKTNNNIENLYWSKSKI